MNDMIDKLMFLKVQSVEAFTEYWKYKKAENISYNGNESITELDMADENGNIKVVIKLGDEPIRTCKN